MKHRSRSGLLFRAAAVLALLGMLAAAAPAAAAGPIEIAVRPFLGGSFDAGGWLGLSVTLTNSGAPTDGHLAVDSPDGTTQRLVELPAGARKEVTLYLRPQVFAREVTVRFEQDGSPPVTATTAVQALNRSSTTIALVGDPGNTLRPQVLAARDAAAAEPVSLAVVDLPDRPEPLRGVETIVWADDSTRLTDAQGRALERWIGSGGQLVVIGGADWQSRTAAFGHLLPLAALSAVDGIDTSALADWTGADSPALATTTAASGAPRDAAQVIVATADGLPLVASMGHGAGRVDYLALDLATAPFRGWEGSAALWSRLIPNNRMAEEFFGGFPIEEDAANSMSQALSTIPALDVPPAELLLAVIVGYILLIGPVSYLVLRRLDRRELAWLTAPVLVVLFTACSYGIGASMKGSEVLLNQVTLVRTSIDGMAASVQTYAGLFSPTRSSYDLSVEADALLAPVRSGWEDPAVRASANFLTEQGDPARLRDLSVGVFGFQALRADTVVAYRPRLSVSWSMSGGSITGTVTNIADSRVEDVAIVSGSGGRRIGDLEPGESQEFSLSLQNPNGSSASDGVYGFSNFNPGDERQRQIATRRQVIDALVGHGGWAGKGVGFGGVDRGPFVIGWRAEEGPIPITVDDHVVQRYAQTVEVLSGRPSLEPGAVTIDPSQLSTVVVSLEGEGFAEGPLYVALGNGEVVYELTLPLEAAALRPTRVTVLTGSDPSMVFGGFQEFGAFLPPGYSVSTLDPRTGEWQLLGSLNERSQFVIDDPASVIDPAGRIRIKIVGEGIDPNFGQTGVFASAQVEGILP